MNELPCPFNNHPKNEMEEKRKMVKLELTKNEVLALKAVAYGCNQNKKLVGSTFIEDIKADKLKKITFYDALIAVSSIIGRIDDGQET